MAEATCHWATAMACRSGCRSTGRAVRTECCWRLRAAWNPAPSSRAHDCAPSFLGTPLQIQGDRWKPPNDLDGSPTHVLGYGRNQRWLVTATHVDMAEAAPVPRRLSLDAQLQRVTLDLN